MRYLLLAASLLLPVGCATPSKAPPGTTKKAPPKKRPPRRPGMRPPGGGPLAAAKKAAKAGDLALAIERANEAIAATPSNEDAYVFLGSACAMKQDLKCERAAYERGLAALPRSAAIRKELGLLHLQQGEVEQAVKRYEEANELSGGDKPEYLADLGYAYVYAGKLDQADQMASRAVALDARCFPCAMALGQVKLTKREFPAAVEAYRGALKITPASPDAQLGLAKASFLDGDTAEAAKIYASLVQSSPDDGRLRIQAAQVAMARKDYKGAVTYLKPVADANPDQKPLLEMLLEAQTQAKDKAGAAATQKQLRALKGK